MGKLDAAVNVSSVISADIGEFVQFMAKQSMIGRQADWRSYYFYRLWQREAFASS